MMKAATFRLVLLVSFAHGLVHVYEHSFASVEQLVAEDPAFDIPAGEGKEVTGNLGTCLRLPFGLCAILAGWLADRYGAKRLLLVYLLGASAAVLLAWWTPTLGLMYLSMFTLGVFASIYHPAGVGLITHHTTPENRTLALGYHGILGSVGIASGPFLAGAVLATGVDWRAYYLVLMVPGVLLALLLSARLSHEQGNANQGASQADPNGDEEDQAHWPSYAMLMLMAAFSGTVYAAILNFMPRYLDSAGLKAFVLPLGIDLSATSDASLRNYLTGVVLLLGAIGQYTAGRIARPRTLEMLLAAAFFLATPFVAWMAVAQGIWRLVAAACFAPAFFMHQPLFNSLVAKYVPRRRRSLCFGLSFTIGFGIGSIGPTLSGHLQSDLVNYRVLAGLLATAAALGLLLWRWNAGGPDRSPLPRSARVS